MLLTWIDFVFIGIVALSTIAGFFRGFFREVASFVVFIAAYLVARVVMYRQPWIAPDHKVALLVAFLVIFFIVLLIGYVIMRFLNMLIEKSPLTLINLLLGAVFGFLRGVVIVLAVIFVVNLTQAKQQAAWQSSYTVTQSAGLLAQAKLSAQTGAR